MATKTEIGIKVLEKLGAISAGETPDTVDQDVVDDAYDSSYGYLRTKHAVSWGSGDDIPTEAVLPVVAFVSNRIANTFGVPRDFGEESQAVSELLALVSVDYSGEPPPAEYF